MKKLTSLLTIICCASALTACTEDHLYYETSHTAYNSTQTVAPSSYYGTAQTPPSPSVGSTTYYTGVPANNPPPASGYSSTQTPSAPPAGYSNNQQQVPGNGYRGNNPGYYANPVNVAQPANATPARANTMNDEYAASHAAAPAKVVPAQYSTSSNVIPVGKLAAIHRDAPRQPAPALPIVKTDKAVALAPDIR